MAIHYENPTSETESDEEIAEKIEERFLMLEIMVMSCINGESNSLIVSGPPGLGKSWTIEKALRAWDANETSWSINKGYVRTTGLLRLLYAHRRAGQVIVFDDADTVFLDDNSLNMLKAVCDTTKTRTVSYLAETNMMDDDTLEKIPRRFEFNGTVIFITNLDFDAMIARQHRLTPHLQALVSRSHYVDLAMHTQRDYLVRIKQIVASGEMLSELSKTQRDDVVNFIFDNADNMRELSLRMALKVATIRKMNSPNWKYLAAMTCCKNKR